jgi:ABC-type transporter Mla subunit MlaD
MKKHLFWIVELLIWLLILFFIASGIIFTKYHYKKNFNTYQLFLPDVDGLINGSPVKMLGIQIGYINQLDIVGDEVYVTFIVTDSNIKIPQGSVVTVEFSGLGGSKSLEIYPPKTINKNSDKLLISQNPKRIHDSLGLLNDMFDKIIEITYDISHFMNQVGIIKNIKKQETNIKIQSTNDFLKISDEWLDKIQQQCDNFHNKLKDKKGTKE